MIDVPMGPSNDPSHKVRLTWKPVTMAKGNGRSALFSCSNGHPGSLFDHSISEDGTVTPSVVCPEDGCTFHEHIRLVGWISKNN